MCLLWIKLGNRCSNADKYTIFLRYGTSNTLDKSLKQYVTNCDNPNEFIDECYKINKMKNVYNSNPKFL